MIQKTPQDMTGRMTILYSSSLMIILVALSSWLTNYLISPNQSDFAELESISVQLEPYTTNIEEVIVPVEINKLMGWWYPGPPACGAYEDAQAVQFDVLKPEYFAVRDGGEFEFMTADTYECNGYSLENIKRVKDLSTEQFVMISSSYAKDMQLFLTHDELTNEYTDQIVSFVVQHDFDGAELDFEDYGGWTSGIYSQYKSFVTRLGNELRANDKQLMIDLPPVRNEVEEQWYSFRLSELEQLPVDYILVMGYDYQFDHGVGEPVAPLDWLREVILFTRNRIQDDSKIVVGVPSYGYRGDKKTGKISILTEEQAVKNVLRSSATRDTFSQEFIAESGDVVLVYQDESSLAAKIDVVEQAGIDKVSIWHLGGNPLPKR